MDSTCYLNLYTYVPFSEAVKKINLHLRVHSKMLSAAHQIKTQLYS
jgi:hypothetical protein